MAVNATSGKTSNWKGEYWAGSEVALYVDS